MTAARRPARPYHHGDLRAALVEAAEGLLEERGVDAFSLREVARRAGVSPGAPAHHFADVRALLTAVAVRAYDDLAQRLERAAGDPRDALAARIARQGDAYVRFALASPGRFDLMWRVALLDEADAEYVRAGDRAYAALDELVRGSGAPVLEKDDPALATTMACWSIVHGFARLALDGIFGPHKAARRRAVQTLLPAMLARLDL